MGNSLTADQRTLLDWLQQHPDLQIETVQAAATTGLGDLDVLHRHASELAETTGQTLRALAAAAATCSTFRPLTERDLDVLPLVGHRVYTEDRDNVHDWFTVATTLAEHRENPDWNAGAFLTRWRYTDPVDVINAVLDAGRGPRFAHELIVRAVETGVAPNTYPITADLTPTVFATLAGAGVTDAVALTGYRSLGLDVAEIAELAHAGVTAGAALAAHTLNLPRPDWIGALAGLPANWFPLTEHRKDPVTDGAIGQCRFTLARLRTLADNGWVDVPLWKLLGTRYGRHNGRAEWSPAQAVQYAEAGLTPDMIERWAAALTAAGKRVRNDEPEQFTRSLLSAQFPGRRGSAIDEQTVQLMVRLKDAKVSPSNLNDYRYAGCATVEDVLTAAAAGISGARAKHLRATYGRTSRYDKRAHFTSVTELLAAHRRDRDATTDAATDAVAP